MDVFTVYCKLLLQNVGKINDRIIVSYYQPGSAWDVSSPPIHIFCIVMHSRSCEQLVSASTAVTIMLTDTQLYTITHMYTWLPYY